MRHGPCVASMGEEPTVEAFMRHLQVCIEEKRAPSPIAKSVNSDFGNSNQPFRRLSSTRTGWRNSSDTVLIPCVWWRQNRRCLNHRPQKRSRRCLPETITAKYAMLFWNPTCRSALLAVQSSEVSLFLFEFPLLDGLENHGVVFVHLVQVFAGDFVGEEHGGTCTVDDMAVSNGS